MNMLSRQGLDRTPSIASARRETEVEVHIDNTVRDAQAFRRLITRTIADTEKFADLGFVKGHDRDTILAGLREFLPPPDAEVERWAEDNFVRDSQ